MLEVDHIETFHGETQALFGAPLTVGAGEVVTLLGLDGAGKTATSRSILGLSPPRAGRVRFEGQEITRTPTHRISRMEIGWAPDDRRLFPALTARRNLALGTRNRPWR
ncbi:ATP-binding cassette domain-containing protein [Azospirillum sp. RWY-5-1]|uniref:ATP-binding cassette domain-containing protein n=1 Tax=Azospirillum oleiclasticum TaxID=2735135 RepID=A0ABX2TAB1_9PROT|nr:ATP-binding cassette domain-containing protein [Azospirillum oleiclasticum]NYZ13849.1 ATP-binding cassette domain-containing protein [Azospirillum oleiclasticum]NYZ21121.1 ATP-binding cassette domain-containing protein [Azospirillum oleiclasticum]